MYEDFVKELQAFYFSRPRDSAYYDPILSDIDKAADKIQETSPYRLKALQYQVITEKFNPKIFKASPYYYEMATKHAWGDGGAYREGKHSGGWLMYRNYDQFAEANPEAFARFEAHRAGDFYAVCGPYMDLLHYCFPYTNVVKDGLKGIWEKAVKERETCSSRKEREFFDCAIEGLLAAKRISERFAEEADRILREDPCLTDAQRKNLEKISDTARRVPWEAPQTFYEALNTVAFLREVSGSLEGIGQNAFGRPDKLLKPFYDNDIARGILTKAEAYDLICKFLLTWDCHHDRDSIFDDWCSHEFEITMNLGGSDENGVKVFNEITRMFIEAHAELNCIFPKLLCRYSSNSNQEYLDLINRYFLEGRSNIMLVNDDCLIPAIYKSGKSLEDARNYISSGCWDVTIEGCEKKPCGEYVNLMRPLEVAIHNRTDVLEGTGFVFSNLESAETFEELYGMILSDIYQVMDTKCELTNIGYRIWSDICPNPFFSICMTGCCESHRDMTAGGAKYNPGAMYFGSFANLINSLLALQDVCFEKKLYTLQEVLKAIRHNWDGYEHVREQIMKAPFFGDEGDESSNMIRRVHKDLCDRLEAKTNAYGGRYDAGYPD